MSNDNGGLHKHTMSHEGGDGSQPEFPGRRSFFAVLTAVGTVSVSALLAVPLLRFALYPLLKRATETPWSDAGDASKFAGIAEPMETQIEVEQLDGWRESISQKSIYVLPPDNGRQRVLSPVCPHLGCDVQWQHDMNRFFCPCHSSVFGPDGSLVQGPATRGMDYLECQTNQGRLMVLYQNFRLLISKREVIG
jgi:quinol---cytochrome c reductase iron-sulfur subunit, bacillus type